MEPILEAKDICQYFGGVHAVDGISLQVQPGEIFGIIGPNGSGKSTFFNSLVGVYKPTSGHFYYRGRDITGLEPHQVVENGIYRTFQNIRTFPSMTVRENLVIGQHVHQTVGVVDALFRTPKYRREEKVTNQKAEELIELVGLSHRIDQLSGCMSYGQQKRLELARAMASEAQVLLLDEPTAGIPQKDADELMELIRMIRDKRGTSIVVIEHNMRVMTSLADRMIAMDRGQKISEGSPQDVLKDPYVIKAYLGEE
jgi:branched-chain amino acid transport system ATP-binding protein